MNKKLNLKSITGLAAGALFAAGLAQAADYSSWTGNKEIKLNTTAAGANVSGNVYNFPVLIRLTVAESTIVKASLAGGADIRFTKADGTTDLPYYIESWANNTAAIWVKVDTIKGNNSTQAIKMFWGKSGVTTTGDSKAVFDTANGFVAAWHMNGAAVENDVTANGLNAEATGSVPAVAGLIGQARSFNNNIENYLSVPNSDTGKLNFDATSNYSLSAWVYADEIEASSGTGHGILNKGNDQWLIGIYGNDEPKYYDLMTRGNNGYNQAATSAAGKEITAQSGVKTWRHVLGVWKGAGTPQDTARIYINGALANETYFNDIANTGSGRNLTNKVYIGVLGGTNLTRPFVGRIDHVTASKVAYDSNWVKLAYENQKPGNSLVDIGTYVEVFVPGAPTGVTATKASATSVTVSWTAPADNGGAAITGYTVTSNPGNQTCQATAPAVTCVVSDLTTGTSYTFTVVATNSKGNSAASAVSNAVTPTASIQGHAFSVRADGMSPYTYRIPASEASVVERLTMTIVDVNGKRVWSHAVNPSKGETEVTWNGRTTSGAKVGAGMYFVRIRIESQGRTTTFDQKSVTLKP